jgi:hypothetical protein
MSTMDAKDDSQDLSGKSPDDLLLKRENLNTEIFELVASQEYIEALTRLEEAAQVDAELEGDVANGTLFKFADIHAALKNWPEAGRYMSVLLHRAEEDLAALSYKISQGHVLNESENMNFHSLPQLIDICGKRLSLYRDYGERIVSLRELLKTRQGKYGSLKENVAELRLKLFVTALPEALRTPVKQVIHELSERMHVASKGDETYREIVDVVSSYVICCCEEADPENERFFIDTIFYEDIEPEDERKKLEKVQNPLAWEDRLKNRAHKILQKKALFIAKHQDIFDKLRSELDRVFHYFE